MKTILCVGFKSQKPPKNRHNLVLANTLMQSILKIINFGLDLVCWTKDQKYIYVFNLKLRFRFNPTSYCLYIIYNTVSRSSLAEAGQSGVIGLLIKSSILWLWSPIIISVCVLSCLLLDKTILQGFARFLTKYRDTYQQKYNIA